MKKIQIEDHNTTFMKQLGLKLKNKIKSSEGMSLTEILASTLIMLLATALLTTVVSLAVSQYIRTLCTSEAHTIYSTLQSIMIDELAYTTEIKVDSDHNVTGFEAQNYSFINVELCTFFIVGDDGTVSKCGADCPYGEVKIGSSASKDAADSSKSENLLGDGAYSNNLKVKITSFTYDEGTHMFTVALKIGRNSDVYIDTSFQVPNANMTESETETEAS